VAAYRGPEAKLEAIRVQPLVANLHFSYPTRRSCVDQTDMPAAHPLSLFLTKSVISFHHDVFVCMGQSLCPPSFIENNISNATTTTPQMP